MAYYQRPEHSLFWMIALVVLPLTLFSAIEGMFFTTSSIVGKDWAKQPSRFNIQCRLHFFAIAITAFLILLCHMDIQAQLTICVITFTFFFMSSINHLLSYIFDNTSKIHLERFIMTVLLWVFLFRLSSGVILIFKSFYFIFFFHRTFYIHLSNDRITTLFTVLNAITNR